MKQSRFCEMFSIDIFLLKIKNEIKDQKWLNKNKGEREATTKQKKLERHKSQTGYERFKVRGNKCILAKIKLAIKHYTQ